MHIIGGAVAFKEALEDFITYQKQVVTNAKLLADELQERFLCCNGRHHTHMVLLNAKNHVLLVAEVVLGG